MRNAPGDVFLDYDLVLDDGMVISRNPQCAPLIEGPAPQTWIRGGLFGFLTAEDAMRFATPTPVTLRMRIRGALNVLECRPPEPITCDATASVRVIATQGSMPDGGSPL